MVRRLSLVAVLQTQICHRQPALLRLLRELMQRRLRQQAAQELAQAALRQHLQ